MVFQVTTTYDVQCDPAVAAQADGCFVVTWTDDGGTGNDTSYVDSTADITTEKSSLASEINPVLPLVSRTVGAKPEKPHLNGY